MVRRCRSAQVVEHTDAVRGARLTDVGRAELLAVKRAGLSDARIALGPVLRDQNVRRRRVALGVTPVFKTIDTCGGEFPMHTPCLYSSYEEESE